MPTIKFDSNKDLYILSDDFVHSCNVDESKFKDYNDAWRHKDWLECSWECGGFAVALQNGFYFVVYRDVTPISLEHIAGWYNQNPELMDIEYEVKNENA